MSTIADGHLMVHVRIRPMPAEDAGRRACIEAVNSSTVSAAVASNRFEHLSFDAVAASTSSQAEIFGSVARNICDACLEGYNGTIFAYGQTGSGKTWTMQGSNTPGSEGLIPRAFEYIFSRFSSDFIYKIKCSYVEIYNEMIFDLLSDGGNRQLQLREDSKRGIVFVEGATEELLQTPQEALQVFWRGCSNRTVAATLLNRESSRSHSVFTLFITGERKGNDGLKDIRTSRFNLVDLAGSERQAATQTMGLRLKEAGNINRSLLALANVINALALADSRHAPYRDSKLTFLLRDSLGGNSKTAVIAAVSPAASCQGETLSTLRFAQRAKLVQNRPMLNQDVWGTLPELQAEIIRLRDLLQHQQLDQQQNIAVKPMIVEYEFNALLFALSQQQKANDCIRLIEEQAQLFQEGQQESAEILRLKSRIEELESLTEVQTCLEYKLYAEELARKLAQQQEEYEVPMQPIVDTTKEHEQAINNSVESAKQALNTSHSQELAQIKESFDAERSAFTKKVSELEHRVKQLQAENEHRREMFQMELEMERRSAERMAAENAILKSKPEKDNSELLKKSLEEQSQLIAKLQKELQAMQPRKESHLEERVQFLSFSLQNAQTDNEVLIAKHATELVNLNNFVEQQRLEIEHLKEENDKLMQHNNFKQKLQYHVKIKQENNELREEVARLQALLNKP